MNHKARAGSRGRAAVAWCVFVLVASGCYRRQPGAAPHGVDARESYPPCDSADECAGPNDNCAAYTSDHEQQFCAALCQSDDECPVVPGYQAVCNFAWCAVVCDGGDCPDGMTCLEQRAVIDSTGASRGSFDVCVTAP